MTHRQHWWALALFLRFLADNKLLKQQYSTAQNHKKVQNGKITKHTKILNSSNLDLSKEGRE